MVNPEIFLLLHSCLKNQSFLSARIAAVVLHYVANRVQLGLACFSTRHCKTFANVLSYTYAM